MDDLVLLTASAIPVDSTHRFRVYTLNVDSNNYAITFRWVLQLPDGSLSENSETFTSVGDGTLAQHFYKTGPGRVISVVAFTTDNELFRGRVFCRVDLIKGDVNDAANVLNLTAGYITTGRPVNYPLAQPEDYISGKVPVQIVTIDDPGAGVDLNYTAPEFSFDRIRGLRFQYSADATVSTREPTIGIYTQSNHFIELPSNASVTANVSKIFFLWFGGSTPTPPAGYVYVPSPDLPILHAITLTIGAANFESGDQLTGIRLYTERRSSIDY